jgi:hypothetical protein
MRNTKIMLGTIATAVITWASVGLIAYLLNDLSLKETLTSGQVILPCLLVGWVPPLIVWADLTE